MAFTLASALAGKQDLKSADISSIVEKHADRLAEAQRQKLKAKQSQDGVKLSDFSGLKLGVENTATPAYLRSAGEEIAAYGAEVKNQTISNALNDPGNKIPIIQSGIIQLEGAGNFASSINLSGDEWSTYHDPNNGLVQSDPLLSTNPVMFEAYNKNQPEIILINAVSQNLNNKSQEEIAELMKNPDLTSTDSNGETKIDPLKYFEAYPGAFPSYIGTTPSGVPMFNDISSTVQMNAPAVGAVVMTDIFKTNLPNLYNETYSEDDIRALTTASELGQSEIIELTKKASLNMTSVKSQARAAYAKYSQIQNKPSYEEFEKLVTEEASKIILPAQEKLMSLSSKTNLGGQKNVNAFNFWSQNTIAYNTVKRNLQEIQQNAPNNIDTFEEFESELAQQFSLEVKRQKRDATGTERDNITLFGKLGHKGDMAQRGDNGKWAAARIGGTNVGSEIKRYDLKNMYFPQLNIDEGVVSEYTLNDVDNALNISTLEEQDPNFNYGDNNQRKELMGKVEELYIGYAYKGQSGGYTIVNSENYDASAMGMIEPVIISKINLNNASEAGKYNSQFNNPGALYAFDIQPYGHMSNDVLGYSQDYPSIQESVNLIQDLDYSNKAKAFNQGQQNIDHNEFGPGTDSLVNTLGGSMPPIK